ncbi:MAG: hypothetical protein R3D26_00415 [Cyanobacteriota/Melainabacteria group bacterium]
MTVVISALSLVAIHQTEAFSRAPQEQMMSYPTYQSQGGSYQSAPPAYQNAPPAYQAGGSGYSQYNPYEYSQYNNQQNQYIQPNQIQYYKQAPRMQYIPQGHPPMPNANLGQQHPNYAPPHYSTTAGRPSFFQLLRAANNSQGYGMNQNTGFNRGNTAPSGRNQALDNRSIARSEADSADACAARASSGSRGSRQDAAYEAQSHADRARQAAEEATSGANSSDAKNYADDAWAAANRAQSAADRAKDNADRGQGW